jgi:yecA family protein
MSSPVLPPFEKISQALEDAELFTNASETHGVLTGFVCGGISLDNKSWQSLFNDVVNEGMALPSAVKGLISDIYADVVKQCNDDGLGFNLLLPDDRKPLDERAEAMAQWSQGFLVGFGMVQQNLNQASEDVQEVIRDIRDISQLSLDFEQEDEESEIAFTEIVEYLRVSAMICFNTFSRSTPSSVSTTLH